MKKLGFKSPDWRSTVYILIGGVLSGVMFISFLFWRQSRNVIKEPLQKLYVRFLQILEKDGLLLDKSEGPKALSVRASEQFPSKSKLINEFIHNYIEARYYSSNKLSEIIKTMKQQLRSF